MIFNDLDTDPNLRTSPAAAMSSPHVPKLSKTELDALRQLLLDRSFVASQELNRSQLNVQAQDPNSSLDLLIRLFFKNEGISVEEALKVLVPLDPGALIASGLLQQENSKVKALFQIQVYNGLLFMADFMPREHPADLVLPIGPSGKYLATVTIRRPINSALDLGCGCGIQAVLLAGHANKVIATDINPRALAITRLNAALNGITNIEVLEGSYFEPVRGKRFDLIVANLPYVITPENKYIYRDISQGGDNSVRQTVQEIPSYLTEGGYAHLMLNWIHKEDQSWWQPVEGWIANHNADAWLMYTNSMTPEAYASQWIMINQKAQPEEYARVKETWLKWYLSQHIERIAFGAISLRRRTSNNNWRCSVLVDKTASEPLGDHILHLFESQDYLNSLRKADEILKKKLYPWNLKIEQISADGYRGRSIKGYLLLKQIHPETALVIATLNGKISLEKAIHNTAKKQKLAPSTIQYKVLNDIYQLMNFGMIVPVL